MTTATAVTTTDAVLLTDVRKQYGDGDGAVVALDGVSLGLATGSFTAVMGPSGSGKSTLLHCAAGLDRASAGSVRLAGVELDGLGEAALSRLRRERVGFVFQSFNLVPSLTAAENVELPLRLAGSRPDRRWVAEIAARVGLSDRLRHKPGELSGGQQQRVAIARALVTRPEVVFADEPTGALDRATGREILGLLRACVDEFAQTLVMVTHDPTAAATADAVVFLADGTVVDRLAGPTAERVAERMTHLEG
jgi:putative ABC transport system ATP-binding protein